MKHTFRILLALAVAILGGAGTAQAATDDLTIVNEVAATDATVAFYMSTSIPTASAPGSTATTVQHGQYLVLKVTPADGKWLYNEMLEVQVVGSPGGALAPPRRAPEVKIAAKPVGLSTNAADGTGYYYYQIPAECTTANGYKNVVVTGGAVSKTATTITVAEPVLNLNVLDEIVSGAVLTPAEAGSLTYSSNNEFVAKVEDGNIKALSEGTATITVSFAGNDKYAAATSKTITVKVGLNVSSVSVDQSTVNLYVGGTHNIVATTTPDGLNVNYVQDDSGVYSVDGDGKITALKEGTGTITVKVGGDGVYAEKTTTVTVTVSKVPTEITVANDNVELKVNEEVATGATLTPAEAGSLSYSSSDESVVKIEAGKIKAVGAGTATITVSFDGNTKYAAAESKRINVKVSKISTELDVSVNCPTAYDPLQNFLISGKVKIKDTETVVAQGSVDIYLGEEFKLTATVKNSGDDIGTFSCDLGPLNAGTYTPKAVYRDEAGKYGESEWTSNYTISKAGTTITIPDSPIELVIGAEANAGAVLSPADAGTLSYLSNDISVATVDASGKVTAVGAGTTTITVSFAGNTNYAAAESKTINVHVTRVLDEGNITLAIPTGGYVYDGTAKTPAVTVKYGEKTLVQGTDYNVSYSNNVNAGENTATVTVTDIAGGDYAVNGTKTFSIAKASLTVKANNKEITYGDAPANNGVDYDGFVGTEDASVLGGTLTYNYNYTQYGNVGDSYTITPGGLTSGNYAISFVGGTLKVGQREVGLNWSTPTTFTFNGSAQAPTATATNTVNGDEISVTVTVSAKSGSSLTGGNAVNVGNYTAEAAGLTGSKNGNYKLPDANTCDFSIGEAGMGEITVTGWNNTYDGAAHGITVNQPSGATVKYRTAASGEYNLTENPTFTDVCDQTVYYQVTKSGYTPVTGSAKVTINKAALTVTAKDKEITYGNAPANDGVTYSGFVNGETTSVLGGTLSYTYNSMANGTGSDYTPTSNIGTYYIIPGGLTSTNYAITFVAGELTVNAKSISSATVSASPASFVYDGSAKTPDVTVILDGKTLIKGTDYEITGYENNTGAGEATVIVTGKGNYQGTVNGSFTITPAEGELAFNPITKTYGDAPFEVAPSTKQSNGDITYSSGNPAVVTVSGNILTIVGFGEATITAHQAASGSYAEETKTFKVTVNKAPLTVKADNKTITYGDAVPVFTVSDENYTGFVYGETKAVLGGTLAFDCTYAQYGDANTYTVTPKNLTSNNYDITFSPGTLTVDQKEVGLMWTNTELTYNATAQKPTVTVTETVNGDEIGVTVTGEKIYVGTGYLATATTLTGAKADNYKLPAVNTQTFSIGQRTLTITANDQTIDYGTAIATGITLVTPTGLQGTDALTAVTLMASTGEVTSDGTINPSGVKIENGGVDVTANYNINLVPGTLIIEYVLNLNAGYCTFCSPFDLLLTGGLKAYTVSAVREDNVYLTEQNAIGKNVAMILYIETAGTLKLRKAPSQDFSSDNTFVGVTDAAGINVEQINGEVYILKDGKFVWSREGVVPQYRCYVVISHAAAARSMGIVVDGETSGIDNLLLSDEEDGNWYSLDGRKLDGKPTAKGIYIMIPADGRSKGKKVMIK